MKRLLAFFRLTNGDGLLSLTYLACYGTFAVYCLHPDATTAATFTATLAHYGYKKFLNRPVPEAPPAPAVDIAPLEAKVKELAAHMATIMNKPALEKFGLVRKP